MVASYLNSYDGAVLDPFTNFGINFQIQDYTHIISDFFNLKDVSKEMWNQVIDKNLAIHLAMDLIKDYDKYMIKVYISKNSLKLSQTRDIMEEEIFDNVEDCNGWLIFINLDVFSNWAHKCEYYFIKSATEIIANKNCFWFPSSYVEIETIFDGAKDNE